MILFLNKIVCRASNVHCIYACIRGRFTYMGYANVKPGKSNPRATSPWILTKDPFWYLLSIKDLGISWQLLSL